ncbi:MAG: polysaccharide biosynthesis/export family protein [Rikenellaceae bacterium]
MKFKELVIATVLLLFSSCASVKNIAYFQDVNPSVALSTAPEKEIRFKPDDKLSIIVSTKDVLLDGLFNLPIATRAIGSNSQSGQNYVATYTVNSDGKIDFPVLGLIKIGGLTRFEVSQEIKNRLILESLVADPIVSVEYDNLVLSVLGEVTNPGRYNIDRDKITIIDALSMAGDLTIYGKRENVTVVRAENGKQVPYRVNLLNISELYMSPVYYLQQNDMVYVEPNDVKARQSTVNGNNVRSTSFWISLASLMTTISLIFIR